MDFKKNPNDIVQTLGADTDAILVTYERDKGELKLFHNGIEIDKAVFAKVLKAETGFLLYLITYKTNLNLGKLHGCKVKIKFTSF